MWSALTASIGNRGSHYLLLESLLSQSYSWDYWVLTSFPKTIKDNWLTHWNSRLVQQERPLMQQMFMSTNSVNNQRSVWYLRGGLPVNGGMCEKEGFNIARIRASLLRCQRFENEVIRRLEIIFSQQLQDRQRCSI